MPPSESEVACFEAGIKFGSLYHQFAGTPVSPESARSLERAMEAAVLNQPYCTEASVEIDDGALRSALVRGYTELSGRFLSVDLVVEYEGVVVEASMSMTDDYPEMRIDAID